MTGTLDRARDETRNATAALYTYWLHLAWKPRNQFPARSWNA